MEADSVLRLLFSANRLKRVPRTGWVMRGVPHAESVSDHTFGVAFTALLLAEMVAQPIDLAKVLTIALLHDLPEAVLGDVPLPAARHFPPRARRTAAEDVLKAILGTAPQVAQWHTWWREFEEQATVEARLVRDADRIDLLIQAHVYAETTGNRWLEEFWADAASDVFQFGASRALFEALSRLRKTRREQRDVA